jgi:hypothetical protein
MLAMLKPFLMNKSGKPRQRANTAKKPGAGTRQNKSARTVKTTTPGSIPGILLRHCPPAIYEKIGQMKVEILKNNRFRGKVSNEEAIYKLIERCG